MLPPWSCPPSALLSALGESPPLPAGRLPSVAVSVDEFRQLVPTDVAPAADENMGNLTVIDQLVNRTGRHAEVCRGTLDREQQRTISISEMRRRTGEWSLGFDNVYVRVNRLRGA
jgi:hypothetical protein